MNCVRTYRDSCRHSLPLLCTSHTVARQCSSDRCILRVPPLTRCWKLDDDSFVSLPVRPPYSDRESTASVMYITHPVVDDDDADRKKTCCSCCLLLMMMWRWYELSTVSWMSVTGEAGDTRAGMLFYTRKTYNHRVTIS